jgi:hypothetical protein
MNSVEQMAQFVHLWDAVQQVEFVDRPDEISWRWTSNGAYTSKTAYLAQLKGTYCTFDALSIWRAHAEGKHKFFAWLLVQTKILTADKLEARNWPCDASSVTRKEKQLLTFVCFVLLLSRFGSWLVTAPVVQLRCRRIPLKMSKFGGGVPYLPCCKLRDAPWLRHSCIPLGPCGRREIEGSSIQKPATSLCFQSDQRGGAVEKGSLWPPGGVLI